jgi:anti-sigma regulatory factor (Ser/Thr protein kinase)
MTLPYSTNIAVADRQDLEEQLDAAVATAIKHALRNPGCGVLVTRRDNRNITVEVTDEVTSGTILERDLRPSRLSHTHVPSNA